MLYKYFQPFVKPGVVRAAFIFSRETFSVFFSYLFEIPRKDFSNRSSELHNKCLEDTFRRIVFLANFAVDAAGFGISAEQKRLLIHIHTDKS